MSILTVFEQAGKAASRVGRTHVAQDVEDLAGIKTLDDFNTAPTPTPSNNLDNIRTMEDFGGGDPEAAKKFKQSQDSERQFDDVLSVGAREDLVDNYGLHSASSNLDDLGADNYAQAFTGISDITGVPEDAMGLGGRLSVGNFTSFTRTKLGLNKDTQGVFTPSSTDKPMINAKQNRYSRDGRGQIDVISTIQHEWMHGLDSYFFDMFTKSGKAVVDEAGKPLKELVSSPPSSAEKIITTLHSISEKDFSKLAYASQMSKLTGMRPELFTKWNRLREAVTDTGTSFYEKARKADLGKDVPYYTDGSELMSRAFESYMAWKRDGRVIQTGAYYDKPSDLKQISALFDDFFSSVKVANVKNSEGLKASHIYGIGSVSAGAMLVDGQDASAASFGLGSAIGAVQRRQSELDNAAGLGGDVGQAPPAQEPKNIAPSLNEWSDTMKERFINESGIDETPSMFWNKVNGGD